MRRLIARLLGRPAPAAPNPYDDLVRLHRGRPVRRIMDIGAHTGETIARWLACFPEAQIDGVEPTPSTFQRLGDRFAREPRATLHQLALGSAEGEARLYASDHDDAQANSLRRPLLANWPEGTQIDELEVRCATLDALTRELGIETIEILKLDVEGAEDQVLEGAASLLREQRIGALVCELRFFPQFEGQPLLADLVTQLAAHDYTLYRIYPPETSALGQAIWADGLFLGSRLRRELAAQHGPGALCQWGFDRLPGATPEVRS